MSLQVQSSVGGAREQRGSRASSATPCQVADCRAAFRRVVAIELPAAWEASRSYSVITVLVGACREHAPELERRAHALLDARADLHNLLTIVETEVAVEADLRQRLAASDADGGVVLEPGQERRPL